MASSVLTPSQAIRSSSGSSSIVAASTSTAAGSNTTPNNTNDSPDGGGNPNGSNRGRQRRRNNKKKNQGNSKSPAGILPQPSSEQEEQTGTKPRNNNNNKKGKNNKSNKKNQAKNQPEGADGSEQGDKVQGQKNPQKKNNRKNNRNRKRYPWRKHIPSGTVDPITLESLASLTYPPFALRAAGPYLPVPAWPPKDQEGDNNDTQKTKEEDAKERERRLLQEQWGNTAAALTGEEDAKQAAQEVTDVNPKHLNLFDGRALAYYMVSQLQFIDPLNRRDLHRDELVELDRYLVRNGFTDLNVTEAYDTKGVTLSSAGAASTTAAGRMEILQQEARVLLNALFGGQNSLPATGNRNNNSNSNNSNSRNNNANNTLMQQYSSFQAAQEREHTRQQRQQQANQPPIGDRTCFTSDEDAAMGMGIYGDEDGGMIVVDDDLDRVGEAYRAEQPSGGAHHNATHLWSAGHITGQHGTQNAASLQASNFPALSTASTLPPSQSTLNSEAPAFVPPGAPAPTDTPAPARAAAKKKPLPPAKSLKFITKAVKKTTPEETQRQFEAREEARRKALLSNLTFGSNPASWNPTDMPQAPSSLPQPTEGQLERNRALADAFGISGASNTRNAASNFEGWKRPTNIGDNVVLYPDELILKAREKMSVLVKLERKWKAFLEDDKAASLPLNHMDRETRAFVHEYSDFWKLHTESFDPEPKRYIHCVKLLDTATPYPLLSDAARDWRGPTGRTASSMPEHASQQTAGQDTRGRSPVMVDLTSPAATAPLPANPRAAALTSERPKLELKERTLPLELPPFEPPAPAVVEAESEEQVRRRRARLEEQKRREQERQERKQKALEAAFASDDEEESLGEVDADSDWEEGEALYAGSDDEE